MKKIITIGIITLSLFATLVGNTQVFATEVTVSQLPIETSTNVQLVNATPKAEVVKWYYRLYNGVYQRRLWSFTEAEWLTEWTNA